MDDIFLYDYKADRDLESILSLEAECFSKPYGAIDFICDSESIIYVLLNTSRELLGYIYIHYSKEYLEIYRLAVKPNFRNHGFGELLIEEAKKTLIKTGASRILLEVKSTNSPAINLYSKCGFITFHRRKEYYSDGSDALEMQFIKETKNEC